MKKFLLVLPVLALMAAACNQTNNTAQNPPAQTSNTTPAQPQDEIATWETYTSAKYQFTIKHPSNWVVVDLGDRFNLLPIEFQGSQPGLGLIIAPLSIGRESVFDAGAKAPITTTTFAGREAKEYKSPATLSLTGHDIRIVNLTGLSWQKDNEISYTLKSEYSSYVSTYEKVLSTLSFTD